MILHWALSRPAPDPSSVGRARRVRKHQLSSFTRGTNIECPTVCDTQENGS